MNQKKQTAFRIRKKDNVATALTELEPGQTRLLGERSGEEWIEVKEKIPRGHKLALETIPEGVEIVKYGVPIGVATRKIEQGTWVHLHCMRSQYDERSGHLNVITGVPEDVSYE